MALTPNQQFLKYAKQSERPLIALKELATLDDFATAIALQSYLKRHNKIADIVCAGGRLPAALSFLTGSNNIQGDLANLRSLTIHINVEKAKVGELSYSMHGDEMRIHVMPKLGAWGTQDIKVATSSYRYDSIFLIGAPDFHSLGSLTKQYPDFFFDTPTIAIDHSAANEMYASINIVDPQATSCAEVLYSILKHEDADAITEEVATALLTGMIAKTKSFKTPNVTPRTLTAASTLMDAKAKRDVIIENLYRTKSVETLRLWGRALSRLKADEERGLVWTVLTRQDFTLSGANEDSLHDIVDEALSQTPNARIVVIFFERPDGLTAAYLFAERPHDALMLGSPFKAAGTREIATLLFPEKSPADAERLAIEHLKKALR